MKRKISIITLILLFFASTTGLPLTLHICKMMEMEKMAECSMCESSEAEIQIPCCSDEMENEINVITDFNDPCCELSLIDNKLSDKFFFSKPNLKEEFSLVSILVVDNYDNQNNFSISSSNRFISESPPGLLTNHLYLNLSVLLI
jgi:hypothetical protein